MTGAANVCPFILRVILIGKVIVAGKVEDEINTPVRRQLVAYLVNRLPVAQVGGDPLNVRHQRDICLALAAAGYGVNKKIIFDSINEMTPDKSGCPGNQYCFS